MNWRVALIASAAVAAIALLVWLLQGGTPRVKQAEVLEVSDVDHILRHEPGPISNPRHYGRQGKKPIDPRVNEAIVRWLGERGRPGVGAGQTR